MTELKAVICAREINEEHKLAKQFADTAIDHAIRCGQLLVEVKETVPHGEWIPWVSSNCEFSERQSQRYMKAAKTTLASELTSDEKLLLGRDIWGHNNIGHRTQGTGFNEWYTPSIYIEAAAATMGGIDLDPASSNKAQKTVKAARFYTVKDNGLSHEWHGRVWLNPPYSRDLIGVFIKQLVNEYQAGRTSQAICLTHNYTDTEWFHAAESAAASICFTRGRIAFEDQMGSLCQPTQGQAFFYFGTRLEKFKKVFSEYGFVR